MMSSNGSMFDAPSGIFPEQMIDFIFCRFGKTGINTPARCPSVNKTVASLSSRTNSSLSDLVCGLTTKNTPPDHQYRIDRHDAGPRVVHVDSDTIAALYAALLQRTGKPRCAVDQLAIGIRLILNDEGGLVRQALRAGHHALMQQTVRRCFHGDQAAAVAACFFWTKFVTRRTESKFSGISSSSVILI